MPAATPYLLCTCQLSGACHGLAAHAQVAMHGLTSVTTPILWCCKGAGAYEVEGRHMPLRATTGSDALLSCVPVERNYFCHGIHGNTHGCRGEQH